MRQGCNSANPEAPFHCAVLKVGSQKGIAHKLGKIFGNFEQGFGCYVY